MIMKFRKKPVVIEAVQWTGENKVEIIKFTNRKVILTFEEDYLIIPTLEGNHKANKGDWIIKGVKGEFYPCKPAIFAETYGRVE